MGGPRAGRGTPSGGCASGSEILIVVTAVPLPHHPPRTLEVGDLMLGRVLSKEGLHKLLPMWEGLFKVVHVSRPGAARLETQEGVPIPNAWNIQHLWRFYP